MCDDRMKQREENLIKRLQSIAFNLESENLDMHFQQFLQMEAGFNGQFEPFYAKYLKNYEELATKYLLKVIKNSNVKYQHEVTAIQYSYFYRQSKKIKNTKHFHFHDCLIELNFFIFLKQFHTGISERAELELPVQQVSEERRIEALIKSRNFCNQECIGCNSFFYQFQPIEINNRQKYYQMEFLGNVRNEKSQNGLRITQQTKQVEYNLERKIDLSNLLDFKSEESLIKLITKILKQKGGFIAIGCKRIQQFFNIKRKYAYEQVSQAYMNVRFVIGQSLNSQQQDRIRNELKQVVQKKIRSAQFGKEVDVTFVPIKPTPFSLGFGMQKFIFNNVLLKAKELHLVLIKVHPTKPKEQYEYVLGQNNEVFCEEYDPELDSEGYNDKELKRLHFFDQVSFDMDEENLKHEQFFFKEYRSYFDNHPCKHIPYQNGQE